MTGQNTGPGVEQACPEHAIGRSFDDTQPRAHAGRNVGIDWHTGRKAERCRSRQNAASVEYHRTFSMHWLNSSEA